jgi:RNA polymerase sigma factor (sigma-70 family)
MTTDSDSLREDAKTRREELSSRGEASGHADSAGARPRSGDIFATTRWTVVLEAGHKSSARSDQALEELCRTYWYPLYAYVRHRGHSREDAEDLTQAFFARFLERNYLKGLDREHGKFRAFLLAALKHFLANEWDHAGCQKRGGHARILSLDWQGAETRYHLDPADTLSPDRVFDREWALALLEQVIKRLRDECVAAGREKLFEVAKVFLTAGKGAIPYAQPAAALGLEEGAVRVAVHRLRRRYRELLREEIAQTLAHPAQVGDELQSLQEALAGG